MTESASPARTATALITGATRGIGRAVAYALAAEGYRPGLVARGREELEAVAREVDGWPFPCDVADPAAVEEMVAEFSARVDGAPDLVVTSAGVFSLHSVESTPDDVLALHLDVNLKGRIHIVRALLPRMKQRGHGTIIQIGSIAGRKAFPGNAAYSASKFGLRGFHEVLLQELAGTGLRATLLEPAATDTPLWDPLDPDRDPGLPDRSGMLRPEEVAEAVLFVASRPGKVQIPYLPIERISSGEVLES